MTLLNEGMLITLPINNTQFSGPPSEEKNPPAQDQPTGLEL